MFVADHYAISVDDVEKSIAFYEKLEFCVIKDYHAEDGSVRIVQMKNGDFILEMFAYPDSEKLPGFVNTLGEDLKVKGSKHLRTSFLWERFRFRMWKKQPAICWRLV